MVDRSSFRGRCLELGFMDGDAGGSFLTMIFGAAPLRALEGEIGSVLLPACRINQGVSSRFGRTLAVRRRELSLPVIRRDGGMTGSTIGLGASFDGSV